MNEQIIQAPLNIEEAAHTKTVSLGKTVYEVNQGLVAKEEKPLKGKALYNKIDETLIPFVSAKILSGTKYLMLLCHDERDYTVIHFDKKDRYNNEEIKDISKNIVEILQNRGPVISIDYDTNNNAVKFWVKNYENKACYYVLFKYDFGVMEV